VKAKEGVNPRSAGSPLPFDVQEYERPRLSWGRRLREPALVELLAESGSRKRPTSGQKLWKKL